jgi:hypothetical protein
MPVAVCPFTKLSAALPGNEALYLAPATGARAGTRLPAHSALRRWHAGPPAGLCRFHREPVAIVGPGLHVAETRFVHYHEVLARPFQRVRDVDALAGLEVPEATPRCTMRPCRASKCISMLVSPMPVAVARRQHLPTLESNVIRPLLICGHYTNVPRSSVAGSRCQWVGRTDRSTSYCGGRNHRQRCDVRYLHSDINYTLVQPERMAPDGDY